MRPIHHDLTWYADEFPALSALRDRLQEPVKHHRRGRFTAWACPILNEAAQRELTGQAQPVTPQSIPPEVQEILQKVNLILHYLTAQAGVPAAPPMPLSQEDVSDLHASLQGFLT